MADARSVVELMVTATMVLVIAAGLMVLVAVGSSRRP